MSQTAHIPNFYRILFLYIDPLLCLSSVYLFFLNQPFYLSSGVPHTLLHPTTTSPNITHLTQYLLRCLGAYSLFIFIMQIGLLHTFQSAPGGLNVKIWKIVQLGILMVDAGVLFAMCMVEGGMKVWEGGEWVNAGILGGLLGARGAFCMGIGMD